MGTHPGIAEFAAVVGLALEPELLQVGRRLEHKPGAKREQAQPGEQRCLGRADTKGHARGERVRQRYHEAPQEGDRPKPGSPRCGAESVLQPGVAPRAGASAIKEEGGQLGRPEGDSTCRQTLTRLGATKHERRNTKHAGPDQIQMQMGLRGERNPETDCVGRAKNGRGCAKCGRRHYPGSSGS